jgi:hypothetical protein
MNQRSVLVTTFVLFALLFGAAGARADDSGPNAPADPLGTGFTYQGQIKTSGNPVNGNCDMGFRLYGVASGGSPVASVISLTVPVTASLFTVGLDFGAGAFDGSARWLDLTVRCPAGSGAFAHLDPRQPLTAAPYALFALNAWSLNGNAGSNSSNFLGTTDNMTLTLGVSNTAVMRYVPNATSPNIIGGYSGNAISPTVSGVVVAGGGSIVHPHDVVGSYATVAGGEGNLAGDHATVGGGLLNQSASYSIVGGGYFNLATGAYATVAGGNSNQATADDAAIAGGMTNGAAGHFSSVGGGKSNQANGDYAIVGGGYGNVASGAGATVGGGGYDGANFAGNSAGGNVATVGGGESNIASGDLATVAGGGSNQANQYGATVSGGGSNTASVVYATVGGGNGNTASGQGAFIGGGGWDGNSYLGNNVNGAAAVVVGGVSNSASNSYSAIGGGKANTASGIASTIPGGFSNTASGNFSFAAGQNAHAVQDGAFIWADSTNTAISTTVANQFLVRASGGVTMYSNSAASIGVQLAPGSGSWSSASDRNLKANFANVDGLQVLDALAGIPIQTWNYQSQDASIRHLGPMAQDFRAAFGLGENDTTISTVDAQGVALAAIQGLYHLAQSQDAQLKSQQAQIDDLQTRLSALEHQPATSPSQLPVTNYQLPPLGWLLFGGLLLLNLGGLLGYLLARGRRAVGGGA